MQYNNQNNSKHHTSTLMETYKPMVTLTYPSSVKERDGGAASTGRAELEVEGMEVGLCAAEGVR